MRLLVIGAGGHAKVVIDAARCAGMEIAGVIGDPSGVTQILGIPVTQDATTVDADAFIVAIGDNARRANAYARMTASGMRAATVVHPSAVIAEQVALGPGAFVAAGAIVNIDADIGANTILNTGCTIDHDCVVGDHALIGPTASLCGGAAVGEGTLIGAGSSIAPTVRVGAWTIVGAGAAVVETLPERSVCVGVPARVVRTTGDPG